MIWKWQSERRRLGVHPGAKVYGIFTLRITITRAVGLPRGAAKI